ncbi:MAG: RDD family protein [Verrucomicrobiota bacterium]
MASTYTMIGADGREYSGSLEELRQWAQDGRLGPSTLVWSAVDERWIEASGRHELAWDLPSPPPPAPVRDEGEPSRLRDAGFVPRLLACVADWMIILFLVDLVLLPWQEEIRSLLQQVQVQLDSRGDSLPDLALLVRLQALFAVLCTGVSLTYMVGFMGRWGATPGKRMVGLSVVTLEGGRPGYPAAFRRYLAGLLTVLSLGLGYLLILGPSRRALHDLISGTRVVFAPRD